MRERRGSRIHSVSSCDGASANVLHSIIKNKKVVQLFCICGVASMLAGIILRCVLMTVWAKAAVKSCEIVRPIKISYSYVCEIK
ncbi:MAG: hypothetical protein HY841_12590 [Bacteroidetes bacterium]|nr:hypothetical protein [Bacteroidota bacterium]